MTATRLTAGAQNPAGRAPEKNQDPTKNKKTTKKKNQQKKLKPTASDNYPLQDASDNYLLLYRSLRSLLETVQRRVQTGSRSWPRAAATGEYELRMGLPQSLRVASGLAPVGNAPTGCYALGGRARKTRGVFAESLPTTVNDTVTNPTGAELPSRSIRASSCSRCRESRNVRDSLWIPCTVHRPWPTCC